MSCIGYNCRGLGNPGAVTSLKEFVKREVPSILFLSETKLSGCEMNKVFRGFPTYDGIAVDSRGRAGGVAMLWKKEVKLELRSMSLHHTDMNVVEGLGSTGWRVTSFYGWPELENRKLSWELLRLLSTNNQDPWMVFGDFNEILFQHEKRRGQERSRAQMEEFGNCLNDCSLQDLGCSGFCLLLTMVG